MKTCLTPESRASAVAQRLDAEPLGRVVSGGEEVDRVLARRGHARLARLAGDERVDTGRDRLAEQRGAGARDDRPARRSRRGRRRNASGSRSVISAHAREQRRRVDRRRERGRHADRQRSARRRSHRAPGRAARCCRPRGGRRAAGGRRRGRRRRPAAASGGRPVSRSSGPRSPQNRPWWTSTRSAPASIAWLEQRRAGTDPGDDGRNVVAARDLKPVRSVVVERAGVEQRVEVGDEGGGGGDGGAPADAPAGRRCDRPAGGQLTIGAPRFELGTSPTRTVRATRLRHAPKASRIAGGAAFVTRAIRGGPTRPWFRTEFDVIVIGAGPAGEVAAGRLASTASASRSSSAGSSAASARTTPACRPRACCARPRRWPRRAASPAPREAVTGELDVAAVLRRRDEIIHELDDSGQLPWLEERGVTLVRGHARLEGERAVRVGDDVLHARQGRRAGGRDHGGDTARSTGSLTSTRGRTARRRRRRRSRRGWRSSAAASSASRWRRRTPRSARR